MPRTRSLAWSELKIGLLTIVALVLAAFLIFALSGSGGFFWQRYTLRTVFANTSGLNEGAQVRIAGVPVGTVTRITFSTEQPEKVEVSFELSKKMQSRVTTESRAVLGSVSLLGESAVDITPSAKGTPIPEGGYVKAGAAAGSIADVTAQATAGISELSALLTDIRSGKGTIGQFLTNDSAYRELNDLIAAAGDVADGIKSGRGTLGRLANNPAAAQALEGALADLQAITARIKAGEGSIGKFLADDSFHRSLTSTTANIDGITGKLNKGEGTAGAMLTERELYDRFNSIAGRLDQVVAALQKGDGTAGAVLHDRQLYDNMNATMVELRKLITAISADPKKYLNVKVSIF